MLPDSSSITAPSLLHKHTRSKGPFLHRLYPVSSVVWPSPTPGLAAVPSDDVWRRDPAPAPSLLHSLQIAFPACRAHYPGGPDQVLVGCRSARSRAGFFPVRAAFPVSQAARRPHFHFRGLRANLGLTYSAPAELIPRDCSATAIFFNAILWICEIRLSLTPSISPISRMVISLV